MPQYEWRCHVCESANDAPTETCKQCGFPFKASSNAILAARAAKNPQARAVYPHTPNALERLDIELGSLPPWRQIIAVIGLLTSIVGGILIKWTFSWTGALIGLAALLGGVIVYLAAVHTGKDASSFHVRPVDQNNESS
ncbi:hypothetical protein HZ993_02945 [Rhodoferax sp. AJA081-3]|uniref:hypothetical protein n=1 Tax=Rhodoferax sp. AJA081-3 TaxID=2752316 RepID=UPI001ADF480B|nr:hypothetical protein [Rhodoferax sp. AJA081-3]QTN28818.1 hypothetical protein HZ993_02945 [Rhodoferax sp. AJA081-3]